MITVVGDSFLDVDVEGSVGRIVPDAPVPVFDQVRERPRPGGAGLAAALAVGGGLPVCLVTAIADDGPGRLLSELIQSLGIRLINVGLEGATGEKIRFQASGQRVMRLDRGTGKKVIGPCTSEALTAISESDAILASDYGQGMLADPEIRRVLGTYAKTSPLIWDPHPRGVDPVVGALCVTPNKDEVLKSASESISLDVEEMGPVVRCARNALKGWGVQSVCVTLGSKGAVYCDSSDGLPMVFPAPMIHAGDTCGAGDKFASELTLSIANAGSLEKAIGTAVLAASEFVANGAATNYLPDLPGQIATASDPLQIVKEARLAGQRIVAVGGCFDVIHAGHLQLLRSAKSLGDCLVVLMNSDESVRRLKGSDRPIVGQHAREQTLLALDMVDAVAVFDEDTPIEILRRLEPDLFVKGGDYAGTRIPESYVVEEFGGTCVSVPHVGGWSTSSIVRLFTTQEQRTDAEQ